MRLPFAAGVEIAALKVDGEAVFEGVVACVAVQKDTYLATSKVLPPLSIPVFSSVAGISIVGLNGLFRSITYF